MTRAQCITSDGSQQRCHVSSCHLPASIEARAPREEDQSELVVGCAKEEEEGGEGEMFRENCCQGDHWKLVREGLARRLRTGLGSIRPTGCVRRWLQLRISPPRSRVYRSRDNSANAPGVPCRERVLCGKPSWQWSGAPEVLRSDTVGPGRRIGQRRLTLPAAETDSTGHGQASP
jgi:hypothetical protein